MKKFTAGIFVLFFAIAAHANMLFENGKSSYSIVLPANANPTEKFAAEELQKILEKSGSVKLPIVTAPGKKGSNIFIKTVPNGKKMEVRDQITIKYDNGDLILQGNKSYCALFAVYRFANRQLGFRWLYGGDDGEFYTPKKKFELTGKVSEVFIPKIRNRHMHMCSKMSDIDSEMWMLRNYHNMGLRTKWLIEKVDVPRFYIAHFGSLRRKKDLFKTNPEYFSMFNGKRSPGGWGGCWTNPGFINNMVEDVCKSIEEKKLDVVYIIAPDMTLRCECGPCNAEKSVPDRWTNLFRIVAKKVKARYPDVKVGTLAYHEYRELPKGDIKFADVAPLFCFSNRCYIHKLGDKNCPYQAKSMAMVDSWKKKFGDVGFYCYEGDIFVMFAAYTPLMNMLNDQMKYFAKVDPYMVLTEFIHGASWARGQNYGVKYVNYYRLNNYIFLTMLHSPELDAKELVREYCDTLYGPAGKIMYKYHSEWAELWDKLDTHLVWYFHNAGTFSKIMFNDQNIAKFSGYLSEAEKIVKSKPEYARYIKEVHVDRINFSTWEKHYRANSTASAEFPLGLGKAKAYKFTMRNRWLGRDGKPISRVPSKMKTVGTIARDANFLYIHVDNFLAHGGAMRPGLKERDYKGFWKDDTFEILIRTDQQNDYFHLAVNPAGGIFDARIGDTSWNPDWQVETKILADRWTADIVIPFSELGYEGDPEGRTWSIGVMRHTAGGKLAGFPFPIFGQISATAKMKFDLKASPEKTITLILPQKPDKMNYTVELTNSSWAVEKESFKEGWTKNPGCKEVIMLTPVGKEAPRTYYRARIDSALDNGSLVIFNDHSYTNWHWLFGDGFPKGVYRHKDCTPDRKLYWVDSKSTSKEVARWEYLIPAACHSAYIPTEGWHVLAQKQLKNGNYAPVMMYKKHRKGMVVLVLGMNHIRKGHVGEFISFLIKRWEDECK